MLTTTISLPYLVYCVKYKLQTLLATLFSIRMCVYMQRGTVMALLWVTRFVSRTRSSSPSFTCCYVASSNLYQCEFVNELCIISVYTYRHCTENSHPVQLWKCSLCELLCWEWENAQISGSMASVIKSFYWLAIRINNQYQSGMSVFRACRF